MRFYSLFVVFTLLSCEVLLAQIDTYPLGDYKRPELRRSTLVVDGRFNSNGVYESNNEDDGSFQKLNLNLNYTKFVNTNDIQKTINHRILSQTDIDVNSDEKIEALLFHRSDYNVKHFNEKNRFIGYNPTIYSEAQHKKNIGAPGTEIEIFLPIGIGQGRIEITNDAWLATSILKALQQEGKLKKEPSHAEITKIADEIARIKNARVLDFRRKRIYELDEIYKFFIGLDLIKENSLAFAIIYDAWQYEVFSTRRTGSVIESYITPKYGYRSSEGNYDFGGAEWSIGYSNNKPINLKWERSFGISINFNSTFFTNTSFKPKLDQFKDNVNRVFRGNYNLAYFLSRRTYFTWRNEMFYSESLRFKSKSIQTQSQIVFVNWLSPQLQFIGSAGLTARVFNSDFNRRSTLLPSVGLSMEYSIF